MYQTNYKPSKGDEIIVFNECAAFGRPYVARKGTVIRRVHATCWQIEWTHGTLDGGRSWRELRRPQVVAAHAVDIIPAADDPIAETERRIAEWKVEHPRKFKAWQIEQAEAAEMSRRMSRELGRIMGDYLGGRRR